MIYPSIAELSDEGVNRYMLSIATAKCARRITDEQLAKKKKVAAVVDKITTGILIALMISPFAILGYIFYWFLTIAQAI